MTEQNLYYLKDLFYRVKQFYYGTSKKTIISAGADTGEASEYIAALKQALNERFGTEEDARPLPPDAHGMLCRACHIILQALTDRNYRMAGDVAAVAVRLCGVYSFPYLGRKKFFEKHVLPLRDKHEEDFFAAEEADFLARPNAKMALKPCFSNKSKNAYYYEEDTDKEMQEAHPVLYCTFAVCGILLLLLSAISFAVIAHAVLALSGAWILLGYFGAVLFGIGLFSILMAWIHQYMGHIPTFLLCGIGILCMLISVYLL